MIKELLFFFCGQAFGLLLIKLFTLIKNHKKELQTNKQTFFHYEPFYVEVKTGKYFCLTDLIKEYGLDKVRHLVAYGVFINENEYEKLKKINRRLAVENKLNYKHHKIYFEKPEKCKRPIGAKECRSKKFLKYDSFVKLRGVLCTHYKCEKCDADYFVAAKNQPNFGV